MRTIVFLYTMLVAAVPVGGYYRNCYRSSAHYRANLSSHYVAPVFAYKQYYEVGADLRNEAIAEKVATKIAEKVLEKIKGSLPTVPLPDAPGVDVPPAPGSAAVQAIFERSCVACHGPAKQDGGLQLLDDQGGFIALPNGKPLKDVAWHVFGLVNSGIMPKGGDPLTDDEVKVVFDWALSLNKE